MKGYKAFNKDLTCKGFQYEIGKEYDLGKEPVVCERGFHFCKNLVDCYQFYGMNEDTRICIIEASGTILTDTNGVKYVTNKIKIVREVKNPREKSNVAKSSSGYCNSGDRNSGVFNTCRNPKIKMFDKESEWTMDDWQNSDARFILDCCPYTYSDFISESSMTDEEKSAHPKYKTIGGFIKTFIATREDKQKWWDNLSDADKKVVMALPNFDSDKFVECMGIEHM